MPSDEAAELDANRLRELIIRCACGLEFIGENINQLAAEYQKHVAEKHSKEPPFESPVMYS